MKYELNNLLRACKQKQNNNNNKKQKKKKKKGTACTCIYKDRRKMKRRG